MPIATVLQMPEDDKRDDYESEEDAKARFTKDISLLYETESAEIEKVRVSYCDFSFDFFFLYIKG